MPESEVGSTDNGASASQGTESSSQGSTAQQTTTTSESTPASRPSALSSLERIAASSAADSGQQKPPTTGAIDQSAQTGVDPVWESIPEQRRNTILDNARKKTEAEVTGRLMEQFGWAKDVNREQVSSAFEIVRALYSDPVAFLRQLESEIRQDPEKARLLEGNQERPKWAPPKAALRSEDGREAYSAEQVMEIVDNKVNEAIERITGQLGPVNEFISTAQQREHVGTIIRESREEAGQVLAEMRQLPHFTKENEPKIAQILSQIPAEVREKYGSVAALRMAYNLFLKNEVFPKLQASTEQTVRQDLRRKAAAGTGTVAPTGSGGHTPPTRPKTVEQLARHMERMAAGQQG